MIQQPNTLNISLSQSNTGRTYATVYILSNSHLRTLSSTPVTFKSLGYHSSSLARAYTFIPYISTIALHITNAPPVHQCNPHHRLATKSLRTRGTAPNCLQSLNNAPLRTYSVYECPPPSTQPGHRACPRSRTRAC